MKAIVQDRSGLAPEDVLGLQEVDRPTIGDDEVLVRVLAASVDRGSWQVMADCPARWRRRIWPPQPIYLNPGLGLAGTVDAVAPASKQGDEVLSTCNGPFAEYGRQAGHQVLADHAGRPRDEDSHDSS